MIENRKKAKFNKFKSMSIIDRNMSKDTFKNAKYSNDDEKELYKTAMKFCESFELMKEKGKSFYLQESVEQVRLS